MVNKVAMQCILTPFFPLLFPFLIPPPVPDDVAVIDEMQMLKDEDRGGAWTRAILGQPATSSSIHTPSNDSHCVLCDPFPPHASSHTLTHHTPGLSAREIHMCGHECAISIVKKLAKSMGEEVEVRV